MRALAKPESSEYFRKYEKPVQDPQVFMNNIQARKLSLAVGIDASQAKQLAWFFELVAKLKLPQNYTRFLSASKEEVIYFNEKTHQQTREHPSTSILKIFFYETLANNKAIYTFTDKQGKLLPFVEQKMLRQSIGLNSKRREAQKVNLQRDESGRMVMSKLEKINPDFKSLLASRSYMLKMLVEKVFTRKEIVGKGKRANAFLSIISEYRNMMKQSSPQKQDEQQQNEQNLAIYHKIFQSAASFYQFEMGQLKDIPPSIINSRQYIESTPENVLKNIFLLNIDKDSIELYWLARMMDCLPLPPNWNKRKGTSFDHYLYQPEELEFDIHPSYIYLMRQLNQFKAIFRQLGALQQNYYLAMRQLNYFDFFERKYAVDMYGYIEKAQHNQNKQEKPDLKMSQNSDWMVLEGIKNTPIVPRAYVLIEHIEKFWDCLDFKDEAWCPAISPYGEVVWSSNVNLKSISFNPYRAKLTNLIKNELKAIPQITDSVLKPEYAAREHPQQHDEEEEEIHLNSQKIQYEREQFLGYYLTHLEKALPWPYEMKPHFQLLDQNNYYEQIFSSPFDLDKGLTQEGQQVPLWLQKARAKNHTIHHTNLLIFNPQSFLAIKQKVVAYALDMVGEHQPHMFEQTEKKLNRINNPEDLLKFLNYINDLDLREQRKKDYIQSLKKDDVDSDIFGSEISQVEVEERLEEELEQAEVENEVEVVKQPSVHEKSVLEQSQSEIPSEPEQESVTTVQQMIPQREQYEFLRIFQRKRYFRPSQMSWLREEEIEVMISKAIKMKRRKTKYKQGLIMGKVKRQISLAEGILNGRIIFIDQSRIDQRKSLKKNLLVTHLRSKCIPFRIPIKAQLTRNDQKYKKRQQSEDECSQITDYQQFHSEIGDYDAREIDQMLIEIKKNRKPQEIARSPTERSLNEHEQTTDTIQLEPIHQIKPEIGLDPVLRHVKRLSVQLHQFRSTFNSKQIAKTTPQKDMRDNIRKVDSLKSLASKEANYASTPLPRNSSLKKLDVQSRLSFVRKEGMGGMGKQYSTQRPFQRVCLEKTASHFLEKEAFLKKGDLITMEARKTLLSKGRGLETFISKYY